jgi:thioredoxin reductase
MNHHFDGQPGVEKLKSQGHDVILLAAGMYDSKALPIKDSDLEGIYPGLVFLRSARTSEEPRLNGQVVVIGGGNVALDAAMTAVRLGAQSVHLFCLESRDQMPAHDWEIAQAKEEGIEIHPGWGPKRFDSGDGRVTGVEFKRCTRVFDKQNRFDPQYDKAEAEKIKADAVIITIGQEVSSEIFGGGDGLSKMPGGTIAVDEELSTGIEGVFAAGDMVRGPSSVIDAIAEGKSAADIIDKYLGGNGLGDPDAIPKKFNRLAVDASIDEFRHERYSAVIADVEKRKCGFGLIQETMTESVAKSEAVRCLQCNIRQSLGQVVLPPEAWRPLNEESVDAVPDVEGVFQLLNAEKKVIRITGSANIQDSLKECLENPGEAVWFIWEEDPMYTKREGELIQQYLQEYGEMPGGGGGDDDLDDLF